LASIRFWREELPEDRIDVAALRNPPCGEVSVGGREGRIGLPKVRVRPQKFADPARNLDVSEVLGDRQDVLLEDRGDLWAIGRHVVAIRSLRAVDVPVGWGKALPDDPPHLFQGRGDHGAACLSAIEEGVLIHLLCVVGMADEDDFHMPIAALDEKIEEHEKALREILHLLRHGAGDVHQAEHDCLRDGFRHCFEAIEADVDRVEEGDLALAPAHLAEPFAQFLQFRGLWLLGFQLRDALFELPHLWTAGAMQGDAPRQAVAHGAQQIEVRGRAAGGIAGPLKADLLGTCDAFLHQVRKFEILKEDVEELFAGEDKAKVVLPLTIGAAFASCASAPTGAGNPVSLLVGLVARKNPLLASRLAIVSEARLPKAVGRDHYLLAIGQIANVALCRGLTHGLGDLTLDPTVRTLWVVKALALGVLPPIYYSILASPCSACLLLPHVPRHRSPHLALGIASLDH